VGDYPFGTIRIFKENNVKIWTLFQKCIIAYGTTFCKNRSTFVINSPNFLSFFSNYFLDFFIFFICMVLQFLDFPNSLFVLLSINESFPKGAKEMESSNSRTFKELKLHEMPSTLGVDSMPCFPHQR
jgi:hypothetical protein